MVYDVDLVVDDLAGVGHPPASHHELVVDAVAERVGHAAVPAGESDPALHGPAQTLLLLVRDLPIVQIGITRSRDLIFCLSR